MAVRGGSRGKKRSTLRSLSQAALDADTAAALYKELSTSSDRAAAILAATSVQMILRRMIIDCFVNKNEDTISMLIERDGALATFFSIAHLARAMGLIPKIFLEDLETIRRIRNVFAHSVLLLDFKHPEIKKETPKLRSLYNTGAPVNELKSETTDPAHSRERNIFISTCQYLSLQMSIDHADNVEQLQAERALYDYY